ncbi:hypothetical protein ACXET9_02310 [Brachybacterium sp. DNPG3]
MIPLPSPVPSAPGTAAVQDPVDAMRGSAGPLRRDLLALLAGILVAGTATVDARALLRNRIDVSTSSFSVDERTGTVQAESTTRFAAAWTQLLVAAAIIAIAVVLGVRLGRRGGDAAPASADGAIDEAADDRASVQEESRSSSPARTSGHSEASTEK